VNLISRLLIELLSTVAETQHAVAVQFRGRCFRNARGIPTQSSSRQTDKQWADTSTVLKERVYTRVGWTYRNWIREMFKKQSATALENQFVGGKILLISTDIYTHHLVLSENWNRSLWWLVRVIGEKRRTCRILVGKPIVKRPLWIPIRWWEDNNKWILGKYVVRIGCGWN
jgi:hypothetical protein